MKSLWAMTFGCCLALAAADSACESIYDEMWRPQVHYSPPSMWMNDPNGMIELNGTYHLYYQFHPKSTVWGPMHWGHATSTDLLHWTTLPVAIEPDAHGAIFSGSAVIDRRNTAGIGSPSEKPLVAIFTYHDHEAERAKRTEVESQGGAYSLDEGRTFRKFPAAVLENPGKRDFRDPQVQWDDDTNRWLMTLVATDHVEFYTSKNLQKWELASTFGADEGDHSGVWECPNLIRVIGSDDRKPHDILMVSVGPKDAFARGGVQYFIGRFDGREFKKAPGTNARWLEHGTDYYAAVTWNRDSVPRKSAPLLLGWMNNWLYATKVPTDPWRGVMALPRTMRLTGKGAGLRVETQPVATLTRLRTPGVRQRKVVGGNVVLLTKKADPRGNALDVNFTLVTDKEKTARVVLENTDGQVISVEFDPLSSKMTLRRNASGNVNFDVRFADPLEATLPVSRFRRDLRIILDRSSIEIFADGGAASLTAQVFPDNPFDRMSVDGDADAYLEDLTVHPLRSVWHDRRQTGSPHP